MHSSAAGVPSPAAGVQLPPSAGRMSRSRPPAETMRNRTLESRSSALQSRTAAIPHGARRPRIGLDGYWGLTAVCRGYYLPLSLFRFPKTFGPRRPAQLLTELRRITQRLHCRAIAVCLTRRSARSVGAGETGFASATNVASARRFRAKFVDPITLQARLPRPPLRGSRTVSTHSHALATSLDGPRWAI
jgi:hypothetical protein